MDYRGPGCRSTWLCLKRQTVLTVRNVARHLRWQTPTNPDRCCQFLARKLKLCVFGGVLDSGDDKEPHCAGHRGGLPAWVAVLPSRPTGLQFPPGLHSIKIFSNSVRQFRSSLFGWFCFIKSIKYGRHCFVYIFLGSFKNHCSKHHRHPHGMILDYDIFCGISFEVPQPLKQKCKEVLNIYKVPKQRR